MIEDLDSAIKSAKGETKIIGGDFNLHPEDHEFSLLTSYLAQNNFLLQSDSTKNTYFSKKSSSCIDFIFSTHSTHALVVSILNNCDSDHLPVAIQVKIPRKYKKDVDYVQKPFKLDIPACEEELTSKSNILNAAETSSLPSILNETLSSHFKPVKKPSETPWLNQFLYQLRKETLFALRKFRETKSDQDRQQHILKRSAYHAHIRHAKSEYYITQIEDLIETTATSFHLLYKRFKFAKQSQARAIPIPFFLQHCINLYNVPSNHSHLSSNIILDNKQMVTPLTEEEVSKILRKFKSRAQSQTCISPHDLKSLHLLLSPHITRIINYSIQTSTIPLSWLESSVFFIHKKGSTSDPNNYRSIAIENAFLNTMNQAILTRLQQHVKEHSLLPE